MPLASQRGLLDMWVRRCELRVQEFSSFEDLQESSRQQQQVGLTTLMLSQAKLMTDMPVYST